MKAVSLKTLIPGHRPDMLNMSGSSGKRVPGQLSHKGLRVPQQHRSRDHIIYSTSSGSQQCPAHNILSRTAMSLPPQRTCLHNVIPAKRRESRKGNRAWRNSLRKWERTWDRRWINQGNTGWRLAGSALKVDSRLRGNDGVIFAAMTSRCHRPISPMAPDA